MTKHEFVHQARVLLANTNDAFINAQQLEQWRSQIRQHDPELARLLEEQHRSTARIGLHLAQKMNDGIAISAEEKKFFGV